MDGRHRFILQRLKDGFNIEKSTTIEQFLSNDKIMSQINDFFRPEGLPTLTFFYQSLPPPESADGNPNPNRGAPVLSLNVASKDKLDSKALYFVRTNAKGVSQSIEQDVCYGEVPSDPLADFDFLLGQVFMPLLQQQSDWGLTPDDAKVEFLDGVGKLHTTLNEAVFSLQGGVQLRSPDPAVVAPIDLKQKSLERAALDDQIVSHLDSVVQEWCSQIEQILIEDNELTRKEPDDVGPKSELEYWRHRSQKFSTIIDQLKTRECRVTLGVLREAKASSPEVHKTLKSWKAMDNATTDAANEAKDNVKYLNTLDKYAQPLYDAVPAQVVEALPALLNNIKMMQQIARYYNTTDRMTTLFVKITNQMITNCKQHIKAPGKLWEQSPEDLIVNMESCLKLYEAYQEQYRIAKDKLLLAQPQDGKQFDFSEIAIFGKFELFCKRLQKLIDMFTTVAQFSSLAKHQVEGMGELLTRFMDILEEFKRKPYDLLNFSMNQFDRDYLEFNVAIHDLETSLQGFINTSFETIPSTEQALALLKQFQTILQRDNLRADLDNKYMVIFHNYGLDLDSVQRTYEKYKGAPPMVRNAPPVAGNITWCRQLLRRIEAPMRKFQTNKSIMQTKESKKIIRTYNKVASALIEFETLWHKAWTKSIETNKSGLAATLIIRHPTNNRLYVNFDHEILQLIRESKCLLRLQAQVPEVAKMILMQDDKFKQYYNHLTFTLREYDRVVGRVNPVIRGLLEQHLDDLESKIEPGLSTITWTSMNIDAYLSRIHTSLTRLEDLVTKLNDIIENRIENNLKFISRTMLVELPEEQFPFQVTDFVNIQEQFVKDQSIAMDQKNLEVERAVYDLIELVDSTPMEGSQGPTVTSEATKKELIGHYYRLMYHAILTSMKNSFNLIKKRVGKTSGGLMAIAAVNQDKPFFEVTVELNVGQVPSVVAKPSLEEVQDAINRTAVAILRSTKRLISWGQDRSSDNAESFFDMLAAEKEVCKLVLLLTGSIEGAKKEVIDYLCSFENYEYLWKNDMQRDYSNFLKTFPTLEDFDDELSKYVRQEGEIVDITQEKIIGVLALDNSAIKTALTSFAGMWKAQYAKNLLGIARKELETIVEYIKGTTLKFSINVEHLDDVRKLMTMLQEIREKESRIDWDFGPVEEKYQLLQHYEVKQLTQDELYQVSELRTMWNKLKILTNTVSEQLGEKQAGFKNDLVTNVQSFKSNVKLFRADYEKNGPCVKGILPYEAIERLNKYDREFNELDRKYTMFNAGEVLFGMPQTQMKSMEDTGKEVKLLKQLYGLYQNVDNTVSDYNDILWIDVVSNIDNMTTEVNEYQRQCKSMPRALKEWDAYEELRKKIEDLLESLPLLQYLSNKSMRARHWNLVMESTGCQFKMDPDSFKLKSLLEAGLIDHSDDIEDISMSATKELGIETKLREIEEQWADCQFSFNAYKNRNQVFTLQGVETAEIQEALEESLMALGGMASSRYAEPFKEDVLTWVHKLGEVSEVIERWLYLQMMWMNLEAVFTGGDIAKQLPQDSKRFVQIDKTWVKIMTKAFEQRNVISLCYGNDMLKFLQPLVEGLEACQKSLSSYLESKRSLFPRFYFVSGPVLLEILSMGSDPQAIQPYFQACFDSIDYVEFDVKQPNHIVAICAEIGKGDVEKIDLSTVSKAEGNIEDWMSKLEGEMRNSLHDIVRTASADCQALSLPDFISLYCAQVCLLGVQMQWTQDANDAIAKAKADKHAMNNASQKITGVMIKLCEMTTDDSLGKRDRTNIETLITIQVHQKDVFDEMLKKKIRDPGDFAWQMQARFAYNQAVDDCVISVADVDFRYCYEFLGCKDRLVITPLTDRCYITLTQALGMCKGGAPAGPAGTGKTETTKDLAAALGKYCVVTNCGPEMTYKNTASIYKGLALCGAWGCFDEFNRIDLEVLSVCAQQIACVLNAIRDKVASFQFTDGQTLSINGEVGYFITMNPGYAGRQELPENLKELFRGVAMMVPDRQIIMKVKLAAAGYQEYAPLSFKFHVLYRLCEQQLSKQAHYDFGLRNILSVLRAAGGALRVEKKAAEKGGGKMRSEYYLLCRTLRDMNMSKYVAEDVGLFLSLINDLFPGMNPEKAVFPDVEAMIKECVEADNLQMHPTWVGKIVQLYETYEVRHGIMVVGAAGCGKSKIIQTLRDALTKCRNKHSSVKLNPKGITAKQMYGFQDPVANEWTEGIFTALWKKSNDPRKKGVNQWMIMDGPVDAIWIEDLNTVLDDNRMLTCANGDRIPMLATMKAMFEPENLNNASPATVSRAGIIYVSASDLGSLPIVQSWIQTRANSKERESLTMLFEKYLEPTLTFLKESGVQAMLNVAEMNYVTTCYNLLQSILPEITEKAACMPIEQLERVFIYCVTWSFGALLEPEDQQRFDQHMRSIAPEECPPAPAQVYDMHVDREAGNVWVDYNVPALSVKPGEDFDFAALLVPTTDSVRTEALIGMHCGLSKPVLLVGGPGTAKTSIVLQYVLGQPKEEVLFKQMNFSSATTPQIFQNIVESSVDKRSAKSFGPPANKKLICFMDDVSMPEINNWGDQPTLEIIRQLTELGYLWNLEKGKAGDPIVIEDLRYVLAMNHPGGGKNDIPQRMKRHCANINIAMPSMTSINQIFGAILKLQYNSKEFKPDVLAVSAELVEITMELYTKTKKKMLPTPAKFHYIFNLRDVSRVFQGMLTCPIDVVQQKPGIALSGEAAMEPDAFVIALWKHECERVFQDKLISKDDKDWLEKCMKSIVMEKMGEALASAAMQDTRFFVNFLRDAPLDPETDEPMGPRPNKYEASANLAQLREKSTEYMNRHDDECKVGKLELVLFDAALHHMARISRILMMPKGSALLVGVGGSGKQSLTKLASYIGGYEKFQIQVSKTYNQSNLMEDIKNQYLKAGFAGLQPNAKPIAFVFTDAEVKEEGFLEYINMILSTGEIPGLIAKDEIEAMIGEMAPLYAKKFPDLEESRDAIIKFFFDQVRANLHIVLCFSPVGEKFRDRALKFPALFSGTTIDWFLPWPEQALQDVACSFFDSSFDVKVDSDAAKQELINHCAAVHMSVTKATQDYFAKFRRSVYVTPKSYLSFIQTYKKVYTEKSVAVDENADKINNGLIKLAEAEEDVAKMKIELAETEKVLAKTAERIEKMVGNLRTKAGNAEKVKAEVTVVKNELSESAAKIGADRDETNRDLEEAKPALDAATKALDAIKEEDLKNLKALKKPPALVARVFDAVLLLRRNPINPVKMDPDNKTKGGNNTMLSSYSDVAVKEMMSIGKFLDEMRNFQTATITEETCELMDFYLEQDDFTPEFAANASNAAAGLCMWCIAMKEYFFIARFVAPKIAALGEAESALKSANAELKIAEDELNEKEAELKGLNDEFSAAMAEKQATQDEADETKAKMDAAAKLINGLGGEKVRWTAQSKEFANELRKLVGDVSRACAFISYCGPFNSPFRDTLMKRYFRDDLEERGLPYTADINMIAFLVSESVIGKWNLEGLPTDDLSTQNGIITTMAERWPIMIDPQAQGHTWVTNRETQNNLKTTSFGDKFFRSKLEDTMRDGEPLLIQDIEEVVDPVLDPVLNKAIIRSGRFLKINLPDKEGCEYSDNFRLYITTKLPNPHYTPELSAQSTIIDFTVTMQGLEDQLLSIVVNKERPELEQQRVQLLKDINGYKTQVSELEAQLLYKLSSVQGNLLDDKDILDVLNNTKKVSQEVSQKLIEAADTSKKIEVTCEEYRPVATRGSITYFLYTDMSLINCMYETSLKQFLKLFNQAMDEAPSANSTTLRIKNIIEECSSICFSYMTRACFERHKLIYVLMLSLKIQLKSGEISATDFGVLLKGGAALDVKTEKKKPGEWLPDNSWLNLCQLSKSIPIFNDIIENVLRAPELWKVWYDYENPEGNPMPEYEGRLNAFLKMLLVRCFREDRFLVSARDYIVETMGKKYLVFKPLDIEATWGESEPLIPLIFLLSPGSNPNAAIEAMAKRKKIRVDAISMGQGQEEKANKLLTGAVMTGSWVLLQNTHLGLGFMNTLEGALTKMEEIDPNFRLWITSEPHPKFPIGLLQISIKMTDEPPQGVKAGLRKSYNWLNQDWIEAVGKDEWKSMLYTVCFMHTVVQERRKFGPLGFNIPYEFNHCDLEASVMYMRSHMGAVELSKGQISWHAVSYMVCEAQYGGRITDDFDRTLFNTYGDSWLGNKIFDAAFEFAPGYKVLKFGEITKYRQAIEDLKDDDHPSVFGMHANADLVFRSKQAKEVINVMMDIQPKDAGAGSGGPSREETVLASASALLAKMPSKFNPIDVIKRLDKLNQGGQPKPLNIHLKQEVDRMQNILRLTKSTLEDLELAIAGTIIMTADLQDALNCMFDARVPPKWLAKSWKSPTLGLWFGNLVNRTAELRSWLENGRPKCFWLTGYFNPQGFLTAVLQEVTRRHAGWALDQVQTSTEITSKEKEDVEKESRIEEGVYVWGLYLEAAAWDKKGAKLCDAPPKKLYCPIPCMFVTAVDKKEAAKFVHSQYMCPAYTVPSKTGLNFIFTANIKTEEAPQKWILRGTALMCSKD